MSWAALLTLDIRCHMAQLRQTLRAGLQTLVEQSVPSPQLAAELLLMHVLGCDRSYIYANPELEVAPEAAQRYESLLAERSEGKPTQYITGHQEFWGLDFEVTPDVLIPRPETEHIVEAVLDLARPLLLSQDRRADRGSRSPAMLHIVDLGTGSGCLAVALAKEFPEARIVATDISAPALAVARRNAAHLGGLGHIEFVEGDLLEPLLDAGYRAEFNFVVSNPPYVSRDEIAGIQREVRDYEPHLALGGLERGGDIYARLFPQAWQLLKPGGYVIVEIGYSMRAEVCSLLGDAWTQIEVRPDLAGVPRLVIARRPLL